MTEGTKINRNYTRSGLAFITSVLFVSNLNLLKKQIILTLFVVNLKLCAWILFGIGIWLVIDPMYYEPAEVLEIENFLNVAYLILVIASCLIILTILISTVLRNENDKLLSIVSVYFTLNYLLIIYIVSKYSLLLEC